MKAAAHLENRLGLLLECALGFLEALSDRGDMEFSLVRKAQTPDTCQGLNLRSTGKDDGKERKCDSNTDKTPSMHDFIMQENM